MDINIVLGILAYLVLGCIILGIFANIFGPVNITSSIGFLAIGPIVAIFCFVAVALAFSATIFYALTIDYFARGFS